MDNFNSHNSVLTDSILDRVQQLFYIPSDNQYIPKNIPSQIEEPPCNNCCLTDWCKASKECCKAFKNYTIKGRYLDQDIGTMIYTKRHGLA